MRKIFFLSALFIFFSCSNDNDNQNCLTIDNRAVQTTWKLISIKNDAGNEIANDCELQNGLIVEKYDPKIVDPFEQDKAILTEGRMENSECQTVTMNNVSWNQFGDRLSIHTSDSHYYYNYLMERVNGNSYMYLTLTSYEDGTGSHIIEELKTLKYQCENIEYFD